MPISLVMGAVLFAALLHAVWNTAVKGHHDRFAMMLMIAVVQSSIAVLLIPITGLPLVEAWPWILITAVPHTTYKIALAKAYDAGDLTKIYPIARGLSIVIVTVISLFVLGEEITFWGMAGIATITTGVFFLSMREKIDVGKFSHTALFLCVIAGSSVAIYTVLDGVGVRIAGDISAFAVWVFIMDGLGMMVYALWHKGSGVFLGLRSTGLAGIIAGSAAFICYWIAIWALAYAPVALVAALRETSVLFSLVLGRFHLTETVGYRRWIAASAVLGGIVMLRYA